MYRVAQWSTGNIGAKRAVNTVPYVCTAAPGIHSTLDLPQVVTALS